MNTSNEYAMWLAAAIFATGLALLFTEMWVAGIFIVLGIVLIADPVKFYKWLTQKYNMDDEF